MAGKKRGKLYTLTEISKKTGISMPTLQRYKKGYQDRIPSEGSGRTQRYPTAAVAVFNELKKENLKRRGRPPKNPAAAGDAARAPKKAAKSTRKKVTRSTRKVAPKKSASGLLTLTEVGRRTGISYPTLLRYVRSSLRRLPHEGTGRARRFHPEAVAVFEVIRGENAKLRGGSRRAGRPAKAARRSMAAAAKRGRPAASTGTGDAGLAQRVASLEKTIASLQRAIERPIRVTLKR